jgi:cell wall-associated NlpC family hydrolase
VLTVGRRPAARRKKPILMRVTSPLEQAAAGPVALPNATVHPPAATTDTPRPMAPAAAPKSYATVKEKTVAGVRVFTAQPPREVRLAVVSPVVVSPAVEPRTTPSVLSSRHKDRELLAQLEADLQRSEKKLTRAGADLTEGQRQLVSFGNELNKAMLEAGPDAKGLHPFVKVAQRYAGTPYVWGGESRSGFDCSGFIIIVMRDLGYKALPHSAAEQFRYGMPIAQSLLKPGDLVFFANTYKPGISHVGIYLGKRRFIHAAGTGIGTIVSSLDSAKFQAHYAGARRLVAGG